jgi:hypothetical protein
MRGAVYFYRNLNLIPSTSPPGQLEKDSDVQRRPLPAEPYTQTLADQRRLHSAIIAVLQLWTHFSGIPAAARLRSKGSHGLGAIPSTELYLAKLEDGASTATASRPTTLRTSNGNSIDRLDLFNQAFRLQPLEMRAAIIPETPVVIEGGNPQAEGLAPMFTAHDSVPKRQQLDVDELVLVFCSTHGGPSGSRRLAIIRPSHSLSHESFCGRNAQHEYSIWQCFTSPIRSFIWSRLASKRGWRC